MGVVEGSTGLRRSKWTVGVRGLKFSWTAKDTYIEIPNEIAWESTSGLTNMGNVKFSSVEEKTKMDLLFQFKAPQVVSGLFRRSSRIRRYTEEVLLMDMLKGFRDVVME